MKSGILVLLAVILMLLLSSALTGINDFRMTDQTELHAKTTTSPATSANCTLTCDLFNDDIANVSSVTSNNTSDAPLAAAYTSSTNALRVDGLITDSSRTLTIVYKRDGLTEAPGASIGAKILPVLLLLAIIGLLAGAVIQATKHGE